MAIDSAAGHSAKAEVRARVLAQRRLLSAEERARRDSARTARTLSALRPLAPLVVACYISADREPGTRQLIAELAETGVRVLVPALAGGLHPPGWAWWTGGRLVAGAAGILTPADEALPQSVLALAELIILPGLAGTASGVRLGRGGGWYDRALIEAAPSVPRWLLLNQDEVLEDLPSQPWDQPVSALITEAGLIECSRK